jgi:hypothetical protein
MTKKNKNKKKMEKEIQKQKIKKIQKVLGNIVHRKSGLGATNKKITMRSRWVIGRKHCALTKK